MAFWVPLLIGAGAGVLKHALVDRPKYERQKKLAAESVRYSPWIKTDIPMPQETDLFGSALQGASMGGMLGQSYNDYMRGGGKFETPAQEFSRVFGSEESQQQPAVVPTENQAPMMLNPTMAKGPLSMATAETMQNPKAGLLYPNDPKLLSFWQKMSKSGGAR